MRRGPGRWCCSAPMARARRAPGCAALTGTAARCAVRTRCSIRSRADGQGARYAESADAGDSADALASGAWAEAITGDPDEAERLLAEVHRVVGASGRVAAARSLRSRHARALALVRRGRFRDSYAPQIAAGELALRLGRADLSCGCWLNAACAAASAGEFDRALEFVDRGSRTLAGSGWMARGPPPRRTRHVLARLGRLTRRVRPPRRRRRRPSASTLRRFAPRPSTTAA